MGPRPGIALKTDITDKTTKEKVVSYLVSEFDCTEKNETLEFGLKWELVFRIMDGDFNGYIGVEHEGLVFTYVADNWPEWEKFKQRGETMEEMQAKLENQFNCSTELHPVTPTS